MKQKKVCVLLGSPRKEGNTAALTEPFVKMLEEQGCSCDLIWLYDKEIKPCIACRVCQKEENWSGFCCSRQDDMQEIAEQVMNSQLIVFAGPIYSCYCTPPTKAAMDRLVYGLSKYYGEKKGPSLWAGKKVALITTCGYPPEKGADIWEAGMKRYCKHSGLKYLGMLAERHLSYDIPFMDEEKEKHSREFAASIAAQL